MTSYLARRPATTSLPARSPYREPVAAGTRLCAHVCCRFGPLPASLFSLFVFCARPLACPLALALPWLHVDRAAQRCRAAVLFPPGSVLVRIVFDRRLRPLARAH
ncbi:hypothetical protein NX875_29180, partial [Burkholderia thailandensis]|nr:hypothetical protein [Burkholderia thailandensis]